MSLWHREGGFGVMLPRRRWLVAAAVPGLVLVWLGSVPFFVLYLGLMSFWLTVHWEFRRALVTAKPMSFCLPGYGESLRRRHLVEGGFVGLTCGLIILGAACLRWPFRDMFDDMLDSVAMPRNPFEWLEPVQVGLAVFGVFCAGVAVHAFSSALGYARSRWMRGGAVVVDCMVWQLVMTSSVRAELCPPTVWFWLLPIWVALGVFSWIRLGDMQYVGQGHRAIIQKQRNQRVQAGKTKGTLPSLESLFLGLMRRHGFFSVGRYCWGELYQNFAMALSQWGWLIALAGCVLIQRIAGEELVGLTLVISGLLAISIRLPLAPDRILLLPAGRRERAVATGVTAIVASLVFVAFGGFVVAISWFLWLLVGALPWERLGVGGFQGINPAWFYWSCLLVPWVTAARLLHGWRARVIDGVLLVAALSLMVGVYLFHTVPASKVHAAYLGVFVVGWLLLLAVLRISSRTCDLASAGA